MNLARECGRVDVIARALYRMALLEEHLGQYQSAETNARQAIDLFRRLGMKRPQSESEALLARLTMESSNG